MVVSEDDGLFWEGTFFWHWDGPSYHEDGWQEQYDALMCFESVFIDSLPEGNVCG